MIGRQSSRLQNQTRSSVVVVGSVLVFHQASSIQNTTCSSVSGVLRVLGFPQASRLQNQTTSSFPSVLWVLGLPQRAFRLQNRTTSSFLEFRVLRTLWVSSEGIQAPEQNNQEPPAQGSVGSVGSGVLPQSIAPETNNQQPSDQSDTSSHKPASVVVGRTGTFVLNTNEDPSNLMSCDDMMAIMGRTNKSSQEISTIPGLPRNQDPALNLVWMRVHCSVHRGTPCISQLASLVFSCSDSIKIASMHKHML